MECNKDEAIKAKLLAEMKMQKKDFVGAKEFALKAQRLFTDLDNILQMICICDVHCSANSNINGNMDWYSILQVDQTADESSIKKQYRRLALQLHPDKNKLPGAETAFKLIGEANVTLSHRGKRIMYDMQRGCALAPQKGYMASRNVPRPPAPQHQSNTARNASTFSKANPPSLNAHNTSYFLGTTCPHCFAKIKHYFGLLDDCPHCFCALTRGKRQPNQLSVLQLDEKLARQYIQKTWASATNKADGEEEESYINNLVNMKEQDTGAQSSKRSFDMRQKAEFNENEYPNCFVGLQTRKRPDLRSGLQHNQISSPQFNQNFVPQKFMVKRGAPVKIIKKSHTSMFANEPKASASATNKADGEEKIDNNNLVNMEEQNISARSPKRSFGMSQKAAFLEHGKEDGNDSINHPKRTLKVEEVSNSSAAAAEIGLYNHTG